LASRERERFWSAIQHTLPAATQDPLFLSYFDLAVQKMQQKKNFKFLSVTMLLLCLIGWLVFARAAAER
jgi:hypothetical protein